MIKRIAVLTSGDDTPGMNAAIRAVTRTALEHDWEVLGIRHGYAGLLNENDFLPLSARSVGGIIQHGGTMLGSITCKEFATESGHKHALQQLEQHNIDALVVAGDEEALSGAYALSQLGFPVNGIPCSLENDLTGTDITVGVDTAMNIALETIDHLKITSSSCCYVFVVEVAGHKCGYLALMSGIAGGAEAVVIPEIETTPAEILDTVSSSYARGKSHAVIVVSEGTLHNADKLMCHFNESGSIGYEVRATLLAEVQRGGAPSAYDRLLGTRLGACAMEALMRGESGVLAGTLNGVMRSTPLGEVIGKTKPLDQTLIRLSNTMTL